MLPPSEHDAAPSPDFCRTEQEWRAWIDGRLPADECDRWARHAERCARCAAALAEVARHSTPFANEIRRAAASPRPTVDLPVALLATCVGLGAAMRTPAERSDATWLESSPPPAGPAALSPGSRLGPYLLERVIGRGGTGIVFQALDLRLRRPAAVKVLHPQLAASVAAQRLEREARLAAAVDDPRIVRIWDVGAERGLCYLVMPLLTGETLEQRLQREGRLPPAECCRLGADIALGLSAVHAAGLVHRDLKPSNIWLEHLGGQVQLLDFGLAFHPRNEPLTGTGEILGTPAYMAPEQARGEVCTPRADLFSLGCVLYRSAVGRPPFEGTHAFAVLSRLLWHTPAPAREVNPDVPPVLSELIGKLLQARPDDRPASASAVAEELRRLAAGAPPPRRSLFRARPSRFAVLGGALILGAGALWSLRSPPAALDQAAPVAARPRELGPGWRRVVDETFDVPAFQGDARHAYGVRDGARFESLGRDQPGVGYAHPLSSDLATQHVVVALRIQTQGVHTALRVRQAQVGDALHYLEWRLWPDGRWGVYRGLAGSSKSGPTEIERPLFKADSDPPLFQDGAWHTLRIEAVERAIRVWHDGRLVHEATDDVDVAGLPGAKYGPVVLGLWADSADAGFVAYDDLEIWTRE